MSDPSTWGDVPDVKVDQGAAQALIRECNNAADAIDAQVSRRRSLTRTATADFEGRYATLFEDNQDIANLNGSAIAVALREVATKVRDLVALVPDENARRAEARAWQRRKADDDSKTTFGDLFFDINDEAPPPGPSEPPPPALPNASAMPRETPHGGGGDVGRTSARPDELRAFVSGSRGAIDELDAYANRLPRLNNAFSSGFDWRYGSETGVDGAGVYLALQVYNELNHQDMTWVRTVADAFERAGSEGLGGVSVLSNAAIAASLKAAGVSTTRPDNPLIATLFFGFGTTTGYADDPVNAATGNFIEPETDLDFTGGCEALELTRMYNSFDRDGGGFGPGWSSWTEVALALDSASARFTHPDGRVSVFPRMGTGWDRATGESLWLAHDEWTDELRMTDNNGGTWQFTPTGVALSHERDDGARVTLVRDADGRLIELEHDRGRSIALTWDPAGARVIGAEMSDGRTVQYGYDDEGRLTTVAGPLGIRTYRWNDEGLIAAVIDADGVVEVENTYDETGRVTSQMSPHGRISRYSYLPGGVTEVADADGTRANTWIHDIRGRLIGVVDADGNRQSTSYDPFGNPLVTTERDGSATVREFDERGHLIRQVTPSGADLCFEYDDQDRLVSAAAADDIVAAYPYEGASRHPSMIIDAEGGKTRLEWADGLLIRAIDPTDVELRYAYNDHGDLVSVTDGDGGVTRLEYDSAGRLSATITPNGHRTDFVRDPAGLITERRDPDGAVWKFEYSTAGRMTALIDPLGSRTSIEYGHHGDEETVIDPLGRSTRYRLDDLGNPAALELPDGSTWRFTHDALSRLTTVTAPYASSWTRSYDTVGHLARLADPTGASVSLRRNRATGEVTRDDTVGRTTYRFDNLGRHTSTIEPDDSTVVTTYDRCGRPTQVCDPEGGTTQIERDLSGRPITITDPVGAVTRYEYDVCGRVSAIIDPLRNRTVIAYDADSQPVRITYPGGETAWIRYDACGRTTAAFTPGHGTVNNVYDAAGRLVETRDSNYGRRRFTYDAAGQLVTATNGAGGITRYDYDANGRCVTVTDPLGNSTRQEFDAMDRCIAQTDPLGRTTRAGFDAVGRLIWKRDPDGRQTEWAYDQAGRLASIAVDGALIAEVTHDTRARTVTISDHTDPAGGVIVHEEVRNWRGRLTYRDRGGQAMRWSYDPSGRRTSMTLPSGQQYRYLYDEADRIVAIDHPLLGRARLSYDESGNLVKAVVGDIRQSWAYSDGFVVAHTSTADCGPARTTIARDNDGRIASIDRDGATTYYVYDEACQLIAARHGACETVWRYDTAGRLVSENHHGGRTVRYVHDAAGQLTEAHAPDGVTLYDYDAAGRRTRTQWPDGSRRDLQWSPAGWLATVTDWSADQSGPPISRTRLHVDATGQLAAVNGAPVFWDSAHADAPMLVQVGTTSVLPMGPVTAVGERWTIPGWRQIRAECDDPWRAAYPESPEPVPGVPGGVEIGAAGELGIAGLEWLHARAYDPDTRGFLSVDPVEPVIGAGWSGNPYSYAGNDPLHALDPAGLSPMTDAEFAKHFNMDATNWLTTESVFKTGITLTDLTRGTAAALIVQNRDYRKLSAQYLRRSSQWGHLADNALLSPRARAHARVLNLTNRAQAVGSLRRTTGPLARRADKIPLRAKNLLTSEFQIPGTAKSLPWVGTVITVTSTGWDISRAHGAGAKIQAGFNAGASLAAGAAVGTAIGGPPGAVVGGLVSVGVGYGLEQAGKIDKEDLEYTSEPHTSRTDFMAEHPELVPGLQPGEVL